MTGREIIVADDNDDMRLLFTSILGISFDLVGVASGGLEALEMWRARTSPVLAVVLDHRMPDLNGLDVARVILEEAPGQCVVLISAQVSEQLEAEAREMGVHTILDKEDIFIVLDVLESIVA